MKDPCTTAPIVTCFATPELKVSLRPPSLLPSAPLLLHCFVQSSISSSASVKAKRRQRDKAPSKNHGGIFCG